jgi:hypothetical protein
VPRNGLSFAVFISRQDDATGFLGQSLQPADHFLFSWHIHIVRLESVVDIDTQCGRLQPDLRTDHLIIQIR